ncbi:MULTISPECIES: sigma-54 interaction domain-containing protein [Bacillus]|uniref:sigma-54 interaction domain-containing protein n=1 Tax=Bacillus TaxID=1386 RepID=UPI0002EAAF0D|nr:MULTISPECIES: sigma-54-dependent Fis family transcriptional regulator [Bacillus]
MRLENHLLSILESLHDAVIVIINDGTIVYINKAYSSNFNVPAKKIIGRKLSDIEANSRILTVLKDGIPRINDCSYVHSLKQDVCANISPLIENGKMIGVVTIMKDISEVTHLQEEIAKYERDLKDLKKQLDRRNFFKLESESIEMQKAVLLSKQIASTDATILLRGESGTGKEVFAKAIHEASNRNNSPFIPINIASVPDSLFESEMFGYEEGSFTGSRKGGKKGLLEMANGGTLLLDEIGEMSFSNQSKLLRVIQERQFQKIGGTIFYPLDVRIICATHRNLEEMIQKGEFREDLYYRINVVPIHIPALRNRKADLEYLTQIILEDVCNKYNKRVTILESVFNKMRMHDWPGNVRELVNTIERMVAVCNKGYIEVSDLPERFLDNQKYFEQVEPINELYYPSIDTSNNLTDILEVIEKNHIEKVLTKCKTKSEAIQQLGISRKSFYSKLKKYNIQ